MPAHSTAFKNAVLNGIVGPNRGSGSPDSWVIRLWSARPDLVGAAEPDWAGYTPPEWDSDDWDAADVSQILTTTLVDMGTPSGAGTNVSTYWALHDAGTDELAFSAPLAEPLNVTAASANPVLIRPTVTHAN